MLTYKKPIFLILFLLLFYITGWAQEIKINEKIPDVFLPEVFRYKKSKLNLRSEFEGKPFIIDFWFTYCASCVRSMPKLDSLHKKYKEKFNVLLSTFEKKEIAERFLTKKNVTRG